VLSHRAVAAGQLSSRLTGSYPVTRLEHVLEPDQLIADLLFGLLTEQPGDRFA